MLVTSNRPLRYVALTIFIIWQTSISLMDLSIGMLLYVSLLYI